MARAPARMAAPPPPRPQAGSGKLILWALTFAAVFFLFTAMVLLFLVGMAPSLVAFVIDRTSKKYAGFTLAAMNFCGVFPYLLELGYRFRDFGAAIKIMTDPMKLLIMYGSASFGWLLYQFVPPVVAAMIAVSAQHKIALLRAQQKDLLKEWGEAIAMPMPGAAGDGASAA
jgi:hypothetical protein